MYKYVQPIKLIRLKSVEHKSFKVNSEKDSMGATKFLVITISAYKMVD